jgi:hypothetical protein
MQADPGIQESRQPVGHQVEEEKKSAVDENNPGYQKDIPVDHPTDKKLPNSGNGESLFDEQTTRQDARGEGAGIRNQGEDRGSKSMEKNELGFGKALGAARPNEIRSESFQETGTDESGTNADEGKSQGKGG